METILQFVADNLLEIVIGAGTLTAILLGKPKTAEKLQKLRKKKLSKVISSQEKLAEKARKNAAKMEELEKEIEKNA